MMDKACNMLGALRSHRSAPTSKIANLGAGARFAGTLGAISSAGERLVHTEEVGGSTPPSPTIFPDSTTHRGDVAELLAAAELLRRGYRVSRPLSNGAAYDLIVDDGTALLRVQVKRAVAVAGGLRASLSTSKYHRGRARVLYEGRCDVVVVVDCDHVRFFAFFGKELASTELRLRTEPTRNNQGRGIRQADDYEMSRAFPFMGDRP